MKQLKKQLYRLSETLVDWLYGAYKNTDSRQRRRLRVLSAFLLLMTIFMLPGAIVMMSYSSVTSTIMLVTSGLLFCGYIISRTRFYTVAVILAIILPAITPTMILILKPTGINLAEGVMWVALPLLVASLMLSLYKAVLIVVSYIVFIIVLAAIGALEVEITAPLLAFMTIITFFVISINNMYGNDQREIENQLKERRHAEKALQESEEKFRNLFEHAKDAILIADLQTQKILDVNTAACKLLGLPKEKIIGKNQSELNPPEMATKYQQSFTEQLQKGFVTDSEIIVKKADGTKIPVDISASMVKLQGKTVILGIFHDISERVRMTQALKESEENISKAFRAIPEAVSIATLKDGRFLEVNDSFLVANGYSREEVIGHTAKELNIWVYSIDRYRTKQLMDKQGHFVNEEFILRGKSGETHNVLLSADVINYNGKSCILTIGYDITERRRAEDELRDSEEKFHGIVEHSNDGIVFIQDGILQYCNSKMLEIAGYTEQEVVGKPFMSFIAPEHKELVLENYRKRVAGEKVPDRYELNMIVKGGRKVYTEVSAKLVNVKHKIVDIAIIRDITQRKKIDAALADEATRRRILVEQSSDGIVILDQNGKVYEANQRFVDMLGYTTDEMKQLHVWDWEFNSPHERLLEMIRTVDEAGDHFETKHKRKDGATYDVEISTNGAIFAGQKLIFCVCRDITERKRAEEELKQTNIDLQHTTAQLQATNKELESFSYSVSHDMRSPLRSIDGFSQALLEDYISKLDEKGKDYLNRLRGASQKMGDLIDGLLKLSRLIRSEMHPEKVDLGMVAKDIIARLQQTEPKRRVKVTIGNNLIANGDPQMVRVLLENLLGNAWKFTSKTQNAQIELGIGGNGDKKTFYIKDNGAGFDMAYQDKLFAAFQRLHNTDEFPGTGIGLATVQRIINRHGGTIRAESEVNKGATFYFSLS